MLRKQTLFLFKPKALKAPSGQKRCLCAQSPPPSSLGIAGPLSMLAALVCLCFVLMFKVGSVPQEKDKIDNLKREQPSPLWSGRASISLAISQPNLMSFLMMGKVCSSKPCRQGPIRRRGKSERIPVAAQKGLPVACAPGSPHQMAVSATKQDCSPTPGFCHPMPVHKPGQGVEGGICSKIGFTP